MMLFRMAAIKNMSKKNKLDDTNTWKMGKKSKRGI